MDKDSKTLQNIVQELHPLCCLQQTFLLKEYTVPFLEMPFAVVKDTEIPQSENQIAWRLARLPRQERLNCRFMAYMRTRKRRSFSKIYLKVHWE